MFIAFGMFLVFVLYLNWFVLVMVVWTFEGFSSCVSVLQSLLLRSLLFLRGYKEVALVIRIMVFFWKRYIQNTPGDQRKDRSRTIFL